MNPSLQLLPTQADDSCALALLINAAFVSERAFIDGDRTDPLKVRSLFDTGTFYILKNGNEIVGCVYTEIRGERGYFGLLAVDAQHQHKGLGTRLVASAEEHCRSHGCLYMDLTYINLRTELPGYYRGLGYIENGTLDLDGGQVARVPIHLVRMSKAL